MNETPIETAPVISGMRPLTVEEATKALVEALVRENKVLPTYAASVIRNAVFSCLMD